MGSVCCGNSQDEERTILVNKEMENERKTDKTIKKLLLLGAGSSGKTTFFKQLKRIHGEGFSHKDKLDYRAQIEHQIIEQMQKLIIRGREMIEDNINSREYDNLNLRSEEAKKSAQYIELLKRDCEINNDIANHIKILWNDYGIQNIWNLRNKFAIPDSCEHFFKKINEIANNDYIPNDEDILLVRKRTTGIIEEHFTIRGTKFHIFDVGGQRNERKKWIHCFENVTAVVFVASLSSYDESLLEDENVNVMHETLNLFGEICNSRWFTHTSIILFLNKRDLFEIKIENVPLNVCFPNYDGMKNYAAALDFIKMVFQSKNHNNKDKNIYIHVTCATDKENVERVFNDVQHAVINSALHTGGLI